MTEVDWLTSTDPQAMLRAMEGFHEPASRTFTGRWSAVTNRKLRLFACACCRQVWDGTACPNCNGENIWIRPSQRMQFCHECPGTGRIGGLTDPRSRRAVEVAERYADGEATEEELQDADDDAERAWRRKPSDEDSSEEAAWWTSTLPKNAAHPELASRVVTATAEMGLPPSTQTALLREICGNPFRPVTLKHRITKVASGEVIEINSEMLSILSWSDRTIPRLAETIYRDRCWEIMGMLADALEDAGCADAAIVGHCRYALPDGNPHVRGCWVLDLLLGKE